MNGSDPRHSARTERLLIYTACVASFLLVALDLGLRHYGMPTDEVVYQEATKRQMDWLGHLNQPEAFTDEKLQSVFHWSPDVVIHPTFSRWLSGATWAVFHGGLGIDEIVAFRLHNAIVFGLIAAGVVGYLLPRCDLAAAIVGLLLLWSDVRLFGHTHTAETDLVLTGVWLWAVLLAVRGFYGDSTWVVVGAAFVAGAVLSTKLTGLLLVGLLAAWPVWMRGWRGLGMAAAFVVIPPLVFYALNPQSWHHPIAWTIDWLAQFRAREHSARIPTMFFGTIYDFRAPWYAPLVHALITTPPAILLLAGVAGFDGARRWLRGGLSNLWAEMRSPWMLMAAAGGTTLVASCLPGVPNHDQERLFLPIQPFLVIAAAYGFFVLSQSQWLPRLFASWSRCPAWLPTTALAVAFVGPSLAVAAHAHPYELAYFNFVIGGPSGAEKRGFDPAYFKLEANQEVIDAINERVEKDAILWSNFLYFDLLFHQRKGRLRQDIKLTQRFPADYVIIYNRPGWWVPLEQKLMAHPETAIWKLEHEGVVLVALFKIQVNVREKDN